MLLYCPGHDCNAEVTLNFSDVLQREAMVCARCGRTIHFSPQAVAEFRRALHEYRGLKDRLEKAQEALVAAASVDPRSGA